MSDKIELEGDNYPFVNVKLVSGEELLALLDPDETTEFDFLFYDPFLILKFYSETGYNFSIVDYLSHSQESSVFIPIDKIITISPMSDSAYDLYFKAITSSGENPDEKSSTEGSPRLRIVKNDEDLNNKD